MPLRRFAKGNKIQGLVEAQFALPSRVSLIKMDLVSLLLLHMLSVYHRSSDISKMEGMTQSRKKSSRLKTKQNKNYKGFGGNGSQENMPVHNLVEPTQCLCPRPGER